MAWRSSRNRTAGARCLITVWCVVLSLSPASGAPDSFSFTAAAATAATATTISPAPAPSPDSDEKPNPVRRFFSWVIQGVTKPFRRRPQIGCSLPPMVSISGSTSSITLPCPTTTSSVNCPSGSEVTLLASATDPADDTLLYTWSVTAGRLRGEGHRVTWDLSGVPTGTYTAIVEVNDGHQHTATAATTVSVSSCKDCERLPPASCTLKIELAHGTINR